MIIRPVLSPGVAAEIVGPSHLLLISERSSALLEGTIYCQVVSMLGGGRTTEEIVDALAERASATEVYYALGVLEADRVISEAPTDQASDGEPGFWHELGLDPRHVERCVRGTRIAVKDLGLGLGGDLKQLLTSVGLEIAGSAELTVVLAADYLDTSLATLNDRAIAAGSRWMLVKPLGTTVWVGPCFVPGVTGCWACLAHRLRLNRPVEAYLAEHAHGARVPVTRSPPGVHAALALATVEIVKVLSTIDAALTRIVTLDLRTATTGHHQLVRRPQCQVCGSPADRPADAAEPIALAIRPARSTSDGGYREFSSEETYERYAHHVSPIIGVVSAVRRIGHAPRHVYVSNQPAAPRHRSLESLRRTYGFRTSGKGRTDAQARASALCEALEHYSGYLDHWDRRRVATLGELGGRAVHPRDLLLFSDRQYRERDTWNASCSPLQRVPPPFDPDVPIEWSPAWSLTAQEPRHLPTSFCYYGYESVDYPAVCRPDSNGNAAGTNLEEAIVQGLLELFERDAVALWWYSRAPRPALDVNSFCDPYVDDLVREYHDLGRELTVLDLTTDLGVPTFAAVTWQRVGIEDILLGFGAHLDARVALTRALTELNQLSVFAECSTVSERAKATDTDGARWAKHATRANQPYLVPLPSPPKPLSDFARMASVDLTENLRQCQRIVEDRGMEVIVLDQTRPDIGLSVAKAVVPGLRHFWRRLAPGRLYDVPVQLGWIDEPLAEQDLNPISMFL